MRLIFPETIHLGLQFEYKNEAIPIIIESDIISPKGKMRSRFMILSQPSLNGIPFIFSPPLLYKPPLSFIQKHTKTPSLLLSWVLVKLSSHILVFLRLKVLSETHSSFPNSSFPPPLGPLPRVSSSTVWILHEGIISFPNLFFMLPWWESKIKAW